MMVCFVLLAYLFILSSSELSCQNGTLLAPTDIPDNLVMDIEFGSAAFSVDIDSKIYCGAEFQVECYWIDDSSNVLAHQASYDFHNESNAYWTDHLIFEPHRRQISSAPLPVVAAHKQSAGAGVETIGMKFRILEKNSRWFNGEPYVDSVYSEVNRSKTVSFYKWIETTEILTVEQRYDRILIHGQKIFREPSDKLEILFFVMMRESDTTISDLSVSSSTFSPLPVVADEPATCPFPNCATKKLTLDLESASACSLDSATVDVHLKLLGALESLEETVVFTINMEEICSIEECTPGQEDDEQCKYESDAILDSYRDPEHTILVLNNVEEDDRVYFEMIVFSNKSITEVELKDVWVGVEGDVNKFWKDGLFFNDGPDYDGQWDFQVTQDNHPSTIHFDMLMNAGVTDTPEAQTFSARAIVVYSDEQGTRREVLSQTMKFAVAEKTIGISNSGNPIAGFVFAVFFVVLMVWM